jgi:integrase/recombinase XerD
MQEGLKSREARQPNKEITLKTIQYKRLEKSFAQWLETLGYARSTVYGMPRQLREFLQWLEQQGITEINKITPQLTADFIHYFKNRPNQRRAGGLSIAHVNKQIDTLQKLSKYLKATGQGTLILKLKKLKEEEIPKRETLTKTEIQQLYDATDNSPIGMRDRAMLGVYYGCGVRKAEGLALEVSDVLFERRLLYVRQAKNGHERYVPINLKVLQDLEIYIYHARPLLIDETYQSETLFISERGKEMKPGAMVCRLKSLQEKTGNPELQNRSFGLHALRHSIATHLLTAGMSLENIALFLGHKTLDSTQLYTHLIND